MFGSITMLHCSFWSLTVFWCVVMCKGLIPTKITAHTNNVESTGDVLQENVRPATRESPEIFQPVDELASKNSPKGLRLARKLISLLKKDREKFIRAIKIISRVAKEILPIARRFTKRRVSGHITKGNNSAVRFYIFLHCVFGYAQGFICL